MINVPSQWQAPFLPMYSFDRASSCDSRSVSVGGIEIFAAFLSDMLGTAHYLPSNFGPVYTRVQLLIDQSAYYHIVTSNKIQAVRLFGRRLLIVLWPYDSLDSIFENKVRNLIAADECAGERATVHCYDQDLLCEHV